LSGETFIRATGMCRLNLCTGACETRPLCGGDWPNYRGSGRDATGVYGSCQSNPNWLGHVSHTLRRCPSGFTLSEGRGVCVRCTAMVPVPTPTPVPVPTPTPVLPRPDLVIRSAFLRQVAGGPVVTSVRRGRSYYACFVVANIGVAPSGVFHVGGGGLGVPTPPSQAHASLAAGASRAGCLVYPTTPAPGAYRLGITADSRTVVTERREDNNGATIAVTVIP
jgi:hypothetical protein